MQLIIVGGANGVGKTTFALQYKKEYGIPYLGADDIASRMPTSSEGNINIEAGKQFFKELNYYLDSKGSIIIESTLSGLSLINRLNDFKKKGFSVHIVYVFVDNVEQCLTRIGLRVLKGGHGVPEEDIKRRYKRSLHNFVKRYSLLAQSWQLIYNGIDRPVEVAIGEAGKTRIIDDGLYRRFLEIAK